MAKAGEKKISEYDFVVKAISNACRACPVEPEAVLPG